MTEIERAISTLLARYSPEIGELATEASAGEGDRSRRPGGGGREGRDDRLHVHPWDLQGPELTVSPYKSHLNIIFSKGVELLEVDSEGLLEGTGKLARHTAPRKTFGERVSER